MVQAASPQVKYLSYEEYYAYEDGSNTRYELIEINLSDILG